MVKESYFRVENDKQSKKSQLKRILVGIIVALVLYSFISTFQDISSVDYNTKSFSNLPENLRSGKKVKNVHIGSSFKNYNSSAKQSLRYNYVCNNGTHCIRKETKDDKYVHLRTCWLTCGLTGSLWPKPTIKHELSSSTTPFKLESLSVYLDTKNDDGDGNRSKSSVATLFSKMRQHFLQELNERSHWYTWREGVYQNVEDTEDISRNRVDITVEIDDWRVENLGLDTDESYRLQILSGNRNLSTTVDTNVTIKAITIFGARHGLETLSQMLDYDSYLHCFQILAGAEIEDNPVFPYRGVMIDTARTFIPVPKLKHIVRAMSFNKLNVLHWHVTDSNSFPFYSTRVPEMSYYGAYSPAKVYTPGEIKDFVEYCRTFGVRVIPELDTPSHAGRGWQWGLNAGYGNLTTCLEYEPWSKYCGQPPCGQLNPLNPKVLDILENVYMDLLELFEGNLFHMGGDEVFEACWLADQQVEKALHTKPNKKNKSMLSPFLSLWGKFQQKCLETLKKSAGSDRNITPIVWSSSMTSSKAARAKFLGSQNYVVQIWTPRNSYEIPELIQEGYRIIFSNVDALYLDMGFGTWLSHEHNYPIKLWQHIYDNNLKKFGRGYITQDIKKNLTERQVLGSVATLWSEKVNEFNAEMKLWPRGSALAENLWSFPSARNGQVYSRLEMHNERMLAKGIHVDQMQPEYCYLTYGHCSDPRGDI